MRLAAAFVALLCLPAAALGAPGCFTPSNPPPIFTIQHAPPPDTDGDPAYKFYPASAATTQDIGGLAASKSKMPAYAGVWTHHGPRGDGKPNFSGKNTPGVEVRFSSPARAKDCSLATTRWILGLPVTLTTGKPAKGAATFYAAPPDAAKETLDRCVMPPGRARPGDSVMLDYEPHDGTTPAEAKAFLSTFLGLVHGAGRKALLYTNPWDSKVQAKSGLDASVIQWIAANFDQVTINVWKGPSGGSSVTASMDAQMKLLGKIDPSKIIVSFQTNDQSTSGPDNHVTGPGTTIADAAAVRARILSAHFGGWMPWRNGASQDAGRPCSDPVNARTLCVAYGTCPMPPTPAAKKKG